MKSALMDISKNNKCYSFIANVKKHITKIAVNVNVNVNVINNKEDEIH